MSEFVQYDLTQTLIPHLDRHLALALLNHLTELDTPLYSIEQLQKAQYELVKGTNMIDYAKQLAEQVKGMEGVDDTMPDFARLREEALQKTEALQKSAEPVLKVIENPEVADRLKGAVDKQRNMELLQKEYNLTLDQVNALYHYGHYQYTYGGYEGAASYLYHFLILSPSHDLNLSAHWGKLCSNILCGEWDAALSEIKDLRDFIDNPQTADQAKPNVQLQARTWLLHWSLFVFFNHENGRQALLELFLSPAYLNTMQTAAPHLLRYVVAAAILGRTAAGAKATPSVLGSRTIRDPIKEVTKIVMMEEYHYADPITGFLKDLYGDFDFEGAQERLRVAEQVLENDFFLNGFTADFLENARWLVSEVYCRIHRRIDITDFSKRLNLSSEDGEKWIVNLIRDSRLGIDAKIDLSANMLHISRPHQTPTATLIETTRSLAFRSQAIHYAMTKKDQTERGGAGGASGGGRGGRAQGGASRQNQTQGQGQTPQQQQQTSTTAVTQEA